MYTFLGNICKHLPFVFWCQTNLAKFTENHLCQSLVVIKDAWRSCFPVNFTKLLRTLFYRTLPGDRFFLVTLRRVGLFLSVAYLMVVNLSWLGVFIQAPLLVLDYRWSHNPTTYWMAVTPNCYWTHTVPKLGHQSSWITGACDYLWLMKVMAWGCKTCLSMAFNDGF